MDFNKVLSIIQSVWAATIAGITLALQKSAQAVVDAKQYTDDKFAELSKTVDEVKSYTDSEVTKLLKVIANLNFDAFGGRNKADWELFIQQTALQQAAVVTNQEKSRLEQLAKMTHTFVIDLDQYVGSDLTDDLIHKQMSSANNLPQDGTVTALIKFQKRTYGEIEMQMSNSNYGVGSSIQLDNSDELIAEFIIKEGVPSLVKLAFFDNKEMSLIQELRVDLTKDEQNYDAFVVGLGEIAQDATNQLLDLIQKYK